jgi:hypothetical protein
MENRAKPLQLNLSPEVKKAMQLVKKFVEDAKFSLPIPTFKLPQLRLLTQDDIDYIEKLIQGKGVKAVKVFGKILESKLELHPGTITEEDFCDYICRRCSARQIEEMTSSETGKLLAKYIIGLTKDAEEFIHEVNQVEGNNISFEERHLSFLNGVNPKNRKPITDKSSYISVVKYAIHFFATKKIPERIKPIQKVNLTKQELSYTFINMWDEKYPKEKRPFELYLFLSSVFVQLKENGLTIDNFHKSILYKKSGKPDNYDDLLKNG